MEFNFNKNTNELIKILANTAQQNNTRIFLVGGVIRDNILKKPLKDIDLIIEGNAIEFSKLLPEGIKIKSIHKDFATVKINYFDINIDIASTRIEKYPYSGCLPVVEKTGVNIIDDVKRRDFTINSLYCEILAKDKLSYNLIDLVNGIYDIKNKTLRVLHDKSYIDDPTRILRGVDFKNRFGFDFSSCDKKLINQYLLSPDIQNASYDRIVSVLKQVLNDNTIKKIVENKYYRIVNTQNLALDFSFINKIIEKFKLNEDDKKEFYFQLILNNEPICEKTNNGNLAYCFYKTKDKNIEKYLKLKEINLLINGFDLLELGFKGKSIGIILDKLKENKYLKPNKFKTKEDEISWVIFNYLH